MNDLKKIETHYKSLPTPDLLLLLDKAGDLRPDAIPLLKAELINRGKSKEAARLDALSEAIPEKKEITYEELQVMVEERLKAGESMDTILLRLKYEGIDFHKIQDLYAEEELKMNQVLDDINQKKEQGAEENEIEEYLQSKYGITPENKEALQEKIQDRANGRLAGGALLIVIGVGFIIGDPDSSGGWRFPITLIVLGLILVLKGRI